MTDPIPPTSSMQVENNIHNGTNGTNGSQEASTSSGATGDKATVSKTNGVVACGVAGSVTVALHPLVIMNISDHYTRIKAQEEIVPKVYGAILGKQNGRHLELFNSFELQHSENPSTGEVEIEMSYFRDKEEQFRQVFKDIDFLGWYTVGSSNATDRDILIHKQLTVVNEGALLVKLDPNSLSANLPVTIYESMVDINDAAPRMLFIEVCYTLVTEEAERIGVDHVARLSSAGSPDVSQVSEHIQMQKSAVKMLHSRINILLEYVKAVKDGELPMNEEIMRNCMSLCQRLPVLSTQNFQENLFDQCNDVLLMSYLAAITKGSNLSNELITKFNLIYDRHGASRRLRGLFF